MPGEFHLTRRDFSASLPPFLSFFLKLLTTFLLFFLSDDDERPVYDTYADVTDCENLLFRYLL